MTFKDVEAIEEWLDSQPVAKLDATTMNTAQLRELIRLSKERFAMAQALKGFYADANNACLEIGMLMRKCREQL